MQRRAQACQLCNKEGGDADLGVSPLVRSAMLSSVELRSSSAPGYLHFAKFRTSFWP